MITIDRKYAYQLLPCDHDGARCRYPDGSLQCWRCWSAEYIPLAWSYTPTPNPRRGLCWAMGCKKVVRSGGLCATHYEEWRRSA